jgi:hypothetical protein
MKDVGRAVGSGSVAEATSLGGDLAIDGGAVLSGPGFLVRFVAEVLELDVKVRRAEDVAEADKSGEGVGEATAVDKIAHLSMAAGGEADEPPSVGAQGLQGDERWSRAFGVGQMSGGNEMAEIGVTLASLGEEDEVMGIVGGGVRV